MTIQGLHTPSEGASRARPRTAQSTSFETGVAAARSLHGHGPLAVAPSTLPGHMLAARRRLLWRRRTAFGLTSALAGAFVILTLCTTIVDGPDAVWATAFFGITRGVALGLAAAAITRSSVGFQLVARSILLAELARIVLPFDLAARHFSFDEYAPIVMILATLVLVSSDRLAPDGGPFAPIRFRRALLFAVLFHGTLAAWWLSNVVANIAFELALYGPDPAWAMHAHAAAIGLAFLAASAGIYWLRTIALFVPLLIGAYFVFRGALGVPASVLSEHGDPGPFSATLSGSWLRMGALILLSVVPIFWGLMRIRIANQERRQ